MKTNIFDIDDIFHTHNFMLSPKRSASKFVILDNTDNLILITGKIDKFPYHALLVEWYCKEYDLAFSWSHKPDLLEIFEKDYSICGGGYVKFQTDIKKYEFYGFSTAYGRFDEKKLKYIIEQSQIFNSAPANIAK